jgi:PIN domain nuclease of toxin-antitoxin system
MRGLIDTSTFLWFISGDPRLSHIAKAFIAETDNEIFLSIASLWEIAIKISLGKLEISMTYDNLLSVQIEENEIRLLPN